MERCFKSFDGVKICYEYNQGKNPLTLVFLHGVGGNWTVWKKELDYFQKKGFSTIAIDLRGHGKSAAPLDFKKYQVTNFMRDIHGVLKSEKIKQYALVGHSLGGAFAIQYCVRYKRYSPAALILIEGACIWPFDHDHLLNKGPYFSHLLKFICQHTPTRRCFKILKDIDLSEDKLKDKMHLLGYLLHITPIKTLAMTLENTERFVFKNLEHIHTGLSQLAIPTLLIAGADDKIMPPELSKIIKQYKKDAKLHIIKGADHHIIMQNADKVSSIMNRFVKENVLSNLSPDSSSSTSTLNSSSSLNSTSSTPTISVPKSL